ncbi:MAG: CehA/McbA family metallohydrolase [Verrucomicrobia bacterium]|nr:CehA/McbA family metallohydrolase [Verrucomicrobiota bacterium]
MTPIKHDGFWIRRVAWVLCLVWPILFLAAEVPKVAEVDDQPVAANAERLLQALEFLEYPLPEATRDGITAAARKRDANALQELLDPQVLFVVSINPELRVKVARGPAAAALHQSGFTPVLVKVLNDAKVSQRLDIESPQAGAVYAGAAEGILQRQQQTELKRNENTRNDPGRFLEVEMFASPPMTERLSGLRLEYAIALIYSSEAGQREATIGFNVGQGTQDLGFRGETPVLFEVTPAIPAKLVIRDVDSKPTIARLTFRDARGRVYPPQAKRLAPDLFFEPQIYRGDGETVLLPPGKFTLSYTRGPEYLEKEKDIVVPSQPPARIEVQLERWIDPMQHGLVSGDHHIHGAGCSHYQIPTEGVTPEDMFRQVKGEALNVGCVLTWGPCFDYQRRFFSPVAATISEPLTVLKYDLEISGFGSAALGHVCLLDLKNQTYPGSDGTKTKGWPTWTVPVLRWTKEQGGVTGYPHSDLFVDPPAYAKRYMARHDKNADGLLDRKEAERGLLPGAFDKIDSDEDGRVSATELNQWAEREANQLPNLVLPAMGGSGAMEIFVSTAAGVCDFISAMNTGRVGEWNTWYHLMNCGFPLKVSGETDFPCMSSRRVGQGRVYVKLADGPIRKVDFHQWCSALGKGRSYVSDGYAHALEFTVNGASPGFKNVELAKPAKVSVRAKVAFAPETPKAVAHGTLESAEGRRFLGDTRVLHAPRSDERIRGGERLVEVVRNGRTVASAVVPADGAVHELSFEVEVERSSWVALRQFPQLHTNPVDVLIDNKPIRASRESAWWCAESVELLWENRSRHIAQGERSAARAAYDQAIELFQKRAREATEQTAQSNRRSVIGN